MLTCVDHDWEIYLIFLLMNRWDGGGVPHEESHIGVFLMDDGGAGEDFVGFPQPVIRKLQGFYGVVAFHLPDDEGEESLDPLPGLCGDEDFRMIRRGKEGVGEDRSTLL